MKNYILPLFFLLIFNCLSAQSLNQAIKIGATFGFSPYEAVNSYGLQIQYDYNLNSSWSLSTKLGLLQGEDINSFGRSQGMDGSDSWDNSYSYKETEQFSHWDLQILYALNKNQQKNVIKIGAGLSFLRTVYSYYDNLYIRRGVIQSFEEADQINLSTMLNLVVQDDFKISERLVLHVNAIFRTAFREHSPFEITVQHEWGQFISTSHILSNFTAAIGLGYLF